MRFASNPENASLNPLPTLLLALALCVFTSQIAAATLYKWVDEKGRVRYSDRLPPAQSNKQHQRLNSQGVVLTTRDAAKTPQQLADETEAQRKLEEEQREESELKAIQDKQDQVLLLTFSNEKEIENARDNRIQVIDSVISLIENSIATAQEKLDQLKHNANQIYASKGVEIPGGLAQKIEHFERKVEIRNLLLGAKVEEKEKIRRKYELDLERFRTLMSASN
ncbi:MAG: DUF4124 domain-containing protein [Gammaproteobacteria bacterium]|nr:DUF4124 domain-containing protein [Gammaproteobacteria bacterium]